MVIKANKTAVDIGESKDYRVQKLANALCYPTITSPVAAGREVILVGQSDAAKHLLFQFPLFLWNGCPSKLNSTRAWHLADKAYIFILLSYCLLGLTMGQGRSQ